HAQLELAGGVLRLVVLALGGGGRGRLGRGGRVQAQLELDLVTAALLQGDAAVGRVLEVDATVARRDPHLAAQPDLLLAREQRDLPAAQLGRRLAGVERDQLEVAGGVRLLLLRGVLGGGLARLVQRHVVLGQLERRRGGQRRLVLRGLGLALGGL